MHTYMLILQVLQVCTPFYESKSFLGWEGGGWSADDISLSIHYTWFYFGCYCKMSHDSQDLASCTILHGIDRSALLGLRLCVSVVEG